jgi:hypothetical protein
MERVSGRSVGATAVLICGGEVHMWPHWTEVVVVFDPECPKASGVDFIMRYVWAKGRCLLMVVLALRPGTAYVFVGRLRSVDNPTARGLCEFMPVFVCWGCMWPVYPLRPCVPLCCYHPVPSAAEKAVYMCMFWTYQVVGYLSSWHVLDVGTYT